MEKAIQIGFAVAAAVYISQASYALFVQEEKEIFLGYLQTGLLFIALGYLEKLRKSRGHETTKNIE